MTKPWKPIFALIGIALLFFILFSLQLDRIISNIFQANPVFLVLAVLTMPLTVLSKSLKWRLLLFEKKNTVSISESIQAFLKGFFLSVTTPGRIGDFSRALFIKNKTGFAFALSSVLLDRLIDVGLLMVLSLLGLYAFFVWFGIWILNPLIILVILFVLIAGLLYVLKKNQTGFFRNLFFSLVPQNYSEKVKETYSELISQFQQHTTKPALFVLPVLLGILNWCIGFLTGFLVASALEIHQPIYFFAIVVLVLSLIEIIPISIGGIGTREAGAIFLFSQVGLGPEIAVSFSLLYFFIGYVLVALVGGLLFIQKPVPV